MLCSSLQLVEISYDILGVHLTCNMGLLSERNGDKSGEKNNPHPKRVGGDGVP